MTGKKRPRLTDKKRPRIGIYAHMMARGGAEKRSAVLAEYLAPRYDVRLLVSGPLNVPELEQYYGVDLSGVTIVPVGSVPRVFPPGVFPSGASGEAHLREKIRAVAARAAEYRALRAQRLDLFVNVAVASKMVCPAPRGVFMCMFPHAPTGTRSFLHGLAQDAARRLTGRHPQAHRSYDVITANSDYTAGWVKRLWGREAEVVYSVCDLIGEAGQGKNRAGEKGKAILSVGRFAADTPDTNYKSHDALIQTFAGMTDLHAAGWRLHLAGSLAPDDPDGAALLRRLRAMAQTLPVSFHVNAPLPELHDLHRRAAIYWHAAGYGYDPETHPIKQEHFGMTTVEAMSAGAVPIVIDSGGQRETVQDGVNGFRWTSLEELAERTRRVLADDSLRHRFSEASRAAAPRYSRASYLTRMERLLASLLA